MADVAAAGFNTVGTYMWARLKDYTPDVLTGETTSGSNLTPETASGTWRNMGANAYALYYEPGRSVDAKDITSLFLRIS
jgi:hypothetical protein